MAIGYRVLQLHPHQAGLLDTHSALSALSALSAQPVVWGVLGRV